VGNLAVAKLFRNDYFRRGWVIQEVVMGKKGYVHWGEGSIYSGVLSLAARLVITLEYRKLMDDEVAWTGVNNWFMMEQLRTRARDHPFIRCLQLARRNMFTDPLDRVYGLLAMAFSEDRTHRACIRNTGSSMLSGSGTAVLTQAQLLGDFSLRSACP
jgi:hypothetical protein